MKFYPARQHIVAYLSSWFQANTSHSNRHGRHGIPQHEIQDLATGIMDKFRQGVESLLIEYRPSGSDVAVQVPVSLHGILWLQGMDPDPESQNTRQHCKQLVSEMMRKTTASVQEPLRSSSEYKPFVSGNQHCFRLPFRTKSSCSRLLSCDKQSTELCQARRGNYCNSDYFESSLQDIFAKGRSIGSTTINGTDVATLLPREWLNDTIVNFWLRWISVPRSPDADDLASKVHVFSSHFLSRILLDGYTPSLQRWVRKINIFDKSLLIFPFFAAGHWSVVAVFNPALIKQTSHHWGNTAYTNDVSCLIHLDPLGPKSSHNGRDIAWAIRLFLNSEFDRHFNNSLDRTSRPFTHRCLPLISPKVVMQTNSYDCGVLTCRFALNTIELLRKPLKMRDVQNKLKHYVSEDPLFDFDGGDITRMRIEIHNLIGSITDLYRNSREEPSDASEAHLQSTAVTDDEGSSDEEDDVVIITQNTDELSVCSGSVWSRDDGADDTSIEVEEDEDLIYDGDGDEGEFRKFSGPDLFLLCFSFLVFPSSRLTSSSSSFFSSLCIYHDWHHHYTSKDDDFIALQNDHPEEESGDTTLNTFVQLGDIIEYRDPSHKSLVKKGAIVSIGALSCSQNIIGLDNGDWLHKGVHQVRRISIKQLDRDGHVPNPYPIWKCLTKIIIITYEDVSDCEGDDTSGREQM